MTGRLRQGKTYLPEALTAALGKLHELSDLHLTLRPFDYRRAADFWGADDPVLG